ncbi:pectin methyltransferase QUA2 [Spatholobus suberectus]|nr:pectin methyltransferase QUA2 [Spatholobus suberectus]
MSRPLHRGVSVRIPDSNNDLWDSQSKDKTEKEGLDRRGSSGLSPSPLRSPYRLLFADNSHSKYGITENGFSSDPFIIGTPRSRHKLVLLFLKFSLVFIVILALAGSFWWTISISTASRGHIYHGYRRLQEKLVSDLLDIGEISYAPSRLKELEFCYQEFENYVPCFNVSDNLALGFSNQDETVLWKKTSKRNCYSKRKNSSPPPLCGRSYDVESPYYRELQNCIGGTHSSRWISVEERETWPSRDHLNKKELTIYGLQSDEFSEDSESWRAAVHNYWSLLSPLIFSDHPKRPGDEDPPPPYNMLRNVLDMNAHFGGFNSALLRAGKSVWVMNVVPVSGSNYLPLIQDRGYVGVLHDWCEAFPTYPRTYDLVHAAGLLSLESSQQRRCTMLDMFIEIDRLLRPEGWIIIRDAVPLIESARALTTRLKWDARVVEIESDSDQRLLICQKPFFKRQAN